MVFHLRGRVASLSRFCLFDTSLIGATAIGAILFLGLTTCTRGSLAQERPTSKVSVEVRDSVRESGEARVVIGLQQTPLLKGDELGTDSANRRVEALQEKALASISSSELQILYRYDSIPALVGEVTSESALQEISASSQVRSVDADAKINVDLDSSVDVIEADQWHRRDVKGGGSAVAVLDTGIDTDHPDLSDDLIDQACFLVSESCPGGDVAEDDNGHGTEVAGIISSSGNEAPRGVAPDAEIIALKVLNSEGSGFLSNAVAALDYLINNPSLDAEVISMSFSTQERETPCDNSSSATESMASALSSLRSDGVIAFGASGNNGTLSDMGAPACVSNVVSIGATNSSDGLAFFSNTDPNLDLVAPGRNIETSGLAGSTSSFTGTSASAPHAAGCAALLRDTGKYDSSDSIETALEISPTEVEDALGRQFPRLNCFINAPDDGPPSAVSGVTVRSSEPENVTFEWDGIGLNEIAKYHVYRDTEPISDPSQAPYDTVSAGTVAYTDSGATEGRAYYYRVETVDVWGNKSNLSPYVAVDFAPPPAVENLSTGETEPRDVEIRWEETPSPDVERYRIYRDTSQFSATSTDILLDSLTAGDPRYRDTTASKGGIYYYRVTTVDTAGNESNLSTGRARVDVDPPTPVTNLSTGATEPGNVQIRWEEAPARDAERYRVYRDTSRFSTARTNILLESLPAQKTQYRDTSAAGKVYHYRVATVDTAGNSGDLSTSTLVDLEPPGAVRSLSVGDERPGNTSLSWKSPEAEDLSKHLVYRDREPISLSENVPFDTLVAGSTEYRDTTTVEGLTFYYQVTAVDTAANEGTSKSEVSVFLYPEEVQADATVSFDEGGANSDDYRLIALPGNIDRTLSTTTEGEPGTDWQAFWDDGTEANFFQKYDGTDRFDFKPGHGIWLTHVDGWEVEETLPTVQLQGDSAASFGLHGGWNIVSNPLDKGISWDRVAAVNGDSLRGLWRFRGSFVRADTFRSAKTGEAFYFLNDAGLDSLSVPYPGAPVPKGEKRSREKESLLTVVAQPANANFPQSAVKVGFSEEASEGLGQLDQPAPPGRFSTISLRLEVPGGDSRGHVAMTERRPLHPEKDGGQTFQLQLQTETEDPIQITASGLDEVNGSEVKLLHPALGRSYDLTSEEPITLERADSTSLKLAVGSMSYVSNQAEKIVPDKLTLTTYPNPLRQQATVEYALPEVRDVRLEVYDVLGRRVAVLEDGRRKAGRHVLKLDADRLSSGVYFSRLRAGGQTRTQKITVVR